MITTKKTLKNLEDVNITYKQTTFDKFIDIYRGQSISNNVSAKKDVITV